MNKNKIKIQLNKVFEMTSAASGIVGIENLHDMKVKKKKPEDDIQEGEMWDKTKKFVKKYKAPLAIGGAVLAGLASKKAIKKKQNNNNNIEFDTPYEKRQEQRLVAKAKIARNNCPNGKAIFKYGKFVKCQ